MRASEHTTIERGDTLQSMREVETNRGWQRLLAEYNAACATFDSYNRRRVILTGSAIGAGRLAAAELAEDEARERVLSVRRRMSKFDPENPESLPIG